MIKRALALAAALAALVSVPAAAQPAAGFGGLDAFEARVLAAHNRERALVGAPPLQWDAGLAAAAASYGPQLVRIGALVHSPRQSRPGQRENLAMAFGRESAEHLVSLWAAEKRYFTGGAFPHVSRTGNWLDVSHYTQMVWKGTTHVGCALARGGGRQFLVCRYSPPGNVDGRQVY